MEKLTQKLAFLPKKWLDMGQGCGFFLGGINVETFGQLMVRVKPIYDLICRDHMFSWQANALVVCHGDVMKAFEAIHREVEILEVLREGFYENCQIVRL